MIRNCLNSQNKGNIRTCFSLLWIAASLCAIIFSTFSLLQNKSSSDVFDLLPVTEESAQLKELHRNLQASFARSIIFAVKDNSSFSKDLNHYLSSSPEVESVISNVDEQQKRKIFQDFHDYPIAFLSPTGRDLYLNSSPTELAKKIFSELYSPLGSPSIEELVEDPYLITRTAMKGQSTGKIFLKDGMLTVEDGHHHLWTIITVRLKKNLSPAQINDWVFCVQNFLKEREQNHPGLEVRYAGAPFHQAEAAENTKADITLLGTVSLILLFLLFFYTFGSFWPVLLCFLPVVVGTAFGLSAAFIFFNKVHSITLVMCISLIGISTDYTTHYIFARMDAPKSESPIQTLKGLKKPLLQALVTTLAAYALMVFSPFPCLKQLGLFAVVGLTASFLCVWLWLPNFFSLIKIKQSKGEARLLNICRWGRKTKFLKAALACFLVSIVFLFLPRIEVDDDLLKLYSSSNFLSDSEHIIRGLTDKSFSQTGVILVASNDDLLDKQVEKLAHTLAQKKDLAPAKYTLPSFTSAGTQQAIAQRLSEVFPSFISQLERIGIEFKNKPQYRILKLGDWFASPLGSPWEPFFLELEQKRGFFIPIETNSKELKVICSEIENCIPWNQREEIQNFLKYQRIELSKIVGYLLVVFFCIFWFFFDLKSSLLQTAAVLFSGIVSLSFLALFGMPFNIFSVFALILVLGIGADYQIFSANPKKRNYTVLAAIMVSAITTLISLGVLVLSRTEAIRNFGLIVCTGIGTAFLLVFLLDKKKSNSELK